MSFTSDLLRAAAAHVAEHLPASLPSWAVYHSLDHTRETVETAAELGAAMRLSRADMEAVLLAAWFHDTGYAGTIEGHEEAGAQKARGFLAAMNAPPALADRVASCILATRMPQRPADTAEQVLCDADLAHIGRKRFFRRSALLRLEVERRTGVLIGEREWLTTSIDFVTAHAFHTPAARERFGERRVRNLALLQERLRAETAAAGKRARKDSDSDTAEKRPERGIETMFRTVPRNHLDLSAMADTKANIMISTNSLIITLVVGLLVSKLDTNPHLIVPTTILLLVCLTAMIFAILATRPIVTSGTFTREDIHGKRANLLFFGNFHRSTLEDFEWGMKEMMKDREYLYGSMIRDLYYLGRVVGRKYRLLRICYTIFMYGLVLAVLAFVTAFVQGPPVVL
jgi:predicted metal-dependent HD superfamily phosphohydrolase